MGNRRANHNIVKPLIHNDLHLDSGGARRDNLATTDGFDAAAKAVTQLKQRPGRQGSLLWDKVARFRSKLLVPSFQFSVKELGLLRRTENRNSQARDAQADGDDGYAYASLGAKSPLLQSLHSNRVCAALSDAAFTRIGCPH